ncbi:type VII secretion protein EccB [Pseudonocardia acaciae]|uniref:type VII secretion protein EccB n=1 Tax=Pseudonocardia acaciae TaxID=551276 RepID=UPI0004902587|nr:type VII secretion protein EccB [Pseudonocardia acaciae]
MARTPVTKLQLDAYRFGQRRLESALARRDPVLLHEEIRGQRRVVATGLALAMLALVATYAYAKLMPKPAWQAEQVVVGKQSGRLFAVIQQPPRLVPVANLAAARLVRYAAERGSGGSSASATPVPIDDADLDTAPRTATAAVPGAQAVLPTEDRPPAPSGPWALCDTGAGTLLVAGAGRPVPLGPGDGLLLAGPDGRRYLVVGGRKHRIDGGDVVAGAYDLRDKPVRPASAMLLAAIPDGRALGAVEPAGAGEDSTALPGHAVGDVVRVVRPGEADRYYLVLATGVQEVAEPVANLVRATLNANPRQPPDAVRLEQINALPRVSLAGLSDYPTVLPRILSDTAACWQWDPSGRGGTVTAPAEPLPPGHAATRLAQADGQGAKLDEVSLPAGTALVACAVAGDTDCSPRRDRDRDRDGEQLWLVSETGVGYPIANAETATALGVRAWTPVPVDALRALPAGPTLDVAQAQRTVDVLAAG